MLSLRIVFFDVLIKTKWEQLVPGPFSCDITYFIKIRGYVDAQKIFYYHNFVLVLFQLAYLKAEVVSGKNVAQDSLETPTQHSKRTSPGEIF